MFAAGKRSIAICDRCGMKCAYNSLKEQVVNQANTGLMVCPSCLDPDHPQYQVGRVSKDDPQALKNPRPEITIDESRGLFGWNPVLGSGVSISVGNVTVTT